MGKKRLLYVIDCFFLCMCVLCSFLQLLSSKHFFVLFYFGSSTVFLLTVPEQLSPLAPPSFLSPVGFSAHFTSAVAISPLRQVLLLEGENRRNNLQSEYILLVYDYVDMV